MSGESGKLEHGVPSEILAAFGKIAFFMTQLVDWCSLGADDVSAEEHANIIFAFEWRQDQTL